MMAAVDNAHSKAFVVVSSTGLNGAQKSALVNVLVEYRTLLFSKMQQTETGLMCLLGNNIQQINIDLSDVCTMAKGHAADERQSSVKRLVESLAEFFRLRIEQTTSAKVQTGHLDGSVAQRPPPGFETLQSLENPLSRMENNGNTNHHLSMYYSKYKRNICKGPSQAFRGTPPLPPPSYSFVNVFRADNLNSRRESNQIVQDIGENNLNSRREPNQNVQDLGKNRRTRRGSTRAAWGIDKYLTNDPVRRHAYGCGSGFVGGKDTDKSNICHFPRVFERLQLPQRSTKSTAESPSSNTTDASQGSDTGGHSFDRTDGRHKIVQFSENQKAVEFPNTEGIVERRGVVIRSATLPLNGENVVGGDAFRRLLHSQGRCKPCAFYYHKKKGCRHGGACEFCHHEEHSKLSLKQWKKQHKKIRLGTYEEAAATESYLGEGLISCDTDVEDKESCSTVEGDSGPQQPSPVFHTSPAKLSSSTSFSSAPTSPSLRRDLSSESEAQLMQLVESLLQQNTATPLSQSSQSQSGNRRNVFLVHRRYGCSPRFDSTSSEGRQPCLSSVVNTAHLSPANICPSIDDFMDLLHLPATRPPSANTYPTIPTDTPSEVSVANTILPNTPFTLKCQSSQVNARFKYIECTMSQPIRGLGEEHGEGYNF